MLNAKPLFAATAVILMACPAFAAVKDQTTETPRVSGIDKAVATGRSESKGWQDTRPSIDDARLNLGVHLGPTFNTATIDRSDRVAPDTGSRTRLAVGLSAEIGLARWFAIQPELNYMQRGLEIPEADGRGTTGSLGFDYLEVPVFAKARYMVGEGVRPFIMTGPSIGFLVGKSAFITDAQGRKQSVPSAELNNQYQGVNFAWNFGLGSDVDLGKQWSMVFDMRYSVGMSNILTTTGQGGDPDASLSLNGFQFFAGIKTSML